MNRSPLTERLRAVFLGELADEVRRMNADLLALEASPADEERLKSVFRTAHTLKGAARAASVSLVEQRCHAVERLLADARDGQRTLGPREFTLLFAVADALEDAGDRLKANQDLTNSPLDRLGEDLAEIMAPPAGATVRRPPSENARSADRSSVASRAPISAPGAAPASAPLPPPLPERGDEQLRVHAGKLDALLNASSQLVVTRGRAGARATELQLLHEALYRWTEAWRRKARRVRLVLERTGQQTSAISAIREADEFLHRLADDTSQLAAGAAEDARGFSLVIDDVQERVRRLRMRPFADACEPLPRMVRDLALTLGKEARIELVGGDVEADRAVLDGLREAIVQLVRNAVDHGIEAPDARLRAGKSRHGVIAISAALHGDHITVRVTDDGVGLDVDAIKRRLVQQKRPIDGDEGQFVRTLLSSGFSTRREVSEISGRGVGLDIVRAAVERIRGHLDLEWVAGKGTTFTIECPPSFATVRCLLVEIGSQLVAIPTSHVDRLLRVRTQDIRRVEGRDVIATSTSPLPLAALARLLPPFVQRPVMGTFPVVVLHADQRQLAVAVDELLAEQEVMLRPLGSLEKPLPHVSGGALLDTGRVALVLNAASIIADGLRSDSGAGVAVAEAKAAAKAAPRVVVVDDSITTRTLEQSVLEAAGYEVRTAVDGDDGWRVIGEFGPDLVVSDIEMPRKDGFELCEAIRSSSRFKELPVVLVTALETPEHRARGLEVGADAFIGKSSFDQQKLLDVIEQLLG